MRVGGVVAIVASGCGRIGFAPTGDGTAGGDGRTGDGAVSTLPVACTSIPALAIAPTIDGVLEPGLSLQPISPVGWNSAIQAAMPDVPVAIALGWRADGLYFMVDLADATRYPSAEATWCGDGVELYVDYDGQYPNAPNFDPVGTRQFVAVAPATSTAPAMMGDMWLKTNRIGVWQAGFSSFPRPGGYVLEAFISGTEMSVSGWVLQRGMSVGFDVGINVSTADGSTTDEIGCPNSLRLGQFFLRVDETIANPSFAAPYWVPSAFCTAMLE